VIGAKGTGSQVGAFHLSVLPSGPATEVLARHRSHRYDSPMPAPLLTVGFASRQPSEYSPFLHLPEKITDPTNQLYFP
jgi:hypothetical protein